MVNISAQTNAKNCIHNIIHNIDKEKNAMTKKQTYRRKISC